MIAVHNLEEMPKSGESLLLLYFGQWKIFVLKIGPELMAVDELFRSKKSEDPEDPQAENRKPTLLYSRRWHMEFEEVELDTYFLLLLYFTR